MFDQEARSMMLALRNDLVQRLSEYGQAKPLAYYRLMTAGSMPRVLDILDPSVPDTIRKHNHGDPAFLEYIALTYYQGLHCLES